MIFSTANAQSLGTCRVAETTKVRNFRDLVSAGSVAVLRTGREITLDDILNDEMIHFKDSNGKISDQYQWMYSPINPVQNRDDKFLSSSVGEDVIITVRNPRDQLKPITITYVGTESGKYLTLVCER